VERHARKPAAPQTAGSLNESDGTAPREDTSMTDRAAFLRTIREAPAKLLRLLEKEGYRYAIRLKTNPVLGRKIAPLLKGPVGRPSHKPKVFYRSFRYQAGSWECARRSALCTGPKPGRGG
jgi:hypothetical protein